ncbi:hypothetical protein Dimus_030166 [Dionaea muscipula]
MKLSFSLQSKPSSKSNLKPSSHGFSADPDPHTTIADHPEGHLHSYVTEFDSSKTLIPNSRTTPIIIPPIENELRPHKKMKNIDLPPLRSSDITSELQFEVESSAAAAAADSNMAYGLNRRKTSGEDPTPRNKPIDDVLLRKLKNDLHDMPDEEGFAQFDEVPVEGFGAALLAGYGWHKGRGIGRNAKGDVKVLEYTRRAAKEGIGFFSDPNPGTHNATGRNSSHVGQESGSDNRVEEQVKTSEILGYAAGTEVRIIVGRDAGLKGRFIKLLSDGDSMLLELSRSGEEVRVRIGDVAELGSKEEENCLRKLKEHASKVENEDRRGGDKNNRDAPGDQRSGRERKERKRGREDMRRDGVIDAKLVRGQREEEKGSQVPWLRSHIRVRIISKELKGGRLYLKKGEVVDVVGPTICDISMDETKELVQGVGQNILETALPRRGGPVLVLLGNHKGVYGSLVERDMERETGVVQDADTHELLSVKLEQIAEYVGDPSYLGY